MKKICLYLLLCVHTLCGFDNIKWTQNYKDALVLSKNSQRPILLLIDRPYCPYCKLLKQEVLSTSKVVKFINENFIAVKVEQNDGTYPQLKFSVYGTPTTFFVDENENKYVSPIIGFAPKEKYLRYLKIGLDKFK